MPYVVAIDGPAGAGKSTVARRLATRLGWRFLDTGAFYRAAALAALEEGTLLEDGQALGRLIRGLPLRQDAEGQTWIGARDVTQDIRTERVTSVASPLSAHGAVREALLGLQRQAAREGDLVCEGRDMGSVVFPDAFLKVYLDAQVSERAKRRLADRPEPDTTLRSVEASLAERDRNDSERMVAPLRRIEGQVYVDTTDMKIEQVVDHLQALVSERLGDLVPRND